MKTGFSDGDAAAFDSNLMIPANSVQTVALAMEDQVSLPTNNSRTFDILANDNDLRDTGRR